MAAPIHTPPTAPKVPENYPLNGLNDDQIAMVNALMEKVPSIALENEIEWCDKPCIVRYLKATKWNLDASLKRLEKTLLWRREYRPHDIKPEDVEEEAISGKNVLSGFDNHGRPITWLIPRKENTKTYDRQIKYVVYKLEKAIKLMPKGVEQVCIIIDYENLNMMSAPPLNVTKMFLQVFGDHYPERMGNLFFLNPSWYLWVAYPLAKPFVDPVTLAKLHFIDLKSQKESNASSEKKQEGTGGWTNLWQHIDPSQVFSEYGGSHQFDWHFDTYWNAIKEIN